jgi:hypothetical protein
LLGQPINHVYPIAKAVHHLVGIVLMGTLFPVNNQSVVGHTIAQAQSPVPLLYSIEKDTFEELKEWKLPIEVTRGMIIDLGDFDGLIIIERPPLKKPPAKRLTAPKNLSSSSSSRSPSKRPPTTSTSRNSNNCQMKAKPSMTRTTTTRRSTTSTSNAIKSNMPKQVMGPSIPSPSSLSLQPTSADETIVGRRCWYVSYSSLCSKQLPLSSWQLLPHLFPSLDPSTATAV